MINPALDSLTTFSPARVRNAIYRNKRNLQAEPGPKTMESNPYEAASTMSRKEIQHATLDARPIQFMLDSYRLIKDQYFMLWAIVFVGLLFGALTPFGLLLGPMLVGIFLCFLEREAGNKASFDHLFRGFDRFIPSLLVTLSMFFCNIVISVASLSAIVIAGFALIVMMSEGNRIQDIPQFILIGGFAIAYSVMLLASLFASLPFVFAFQLIAEHNLSAGEAMIASARAVLHNLWPLAITFISFSFFGLIAMLMCYLPALLLAPIQFGAGFLVYREIFPRQLQAETPVAIHPKTM